MVKNKEEYFEKVVKWEEEPNGNFTFGSFLFIGMTIVCIILVAIFSDEKYVGLEWVVIFIMLQGVANLFVSLWLFLSGRGYGKRVLWRKING